MSSNNFITKSKENVIYQGLANYYVSDGVSVGGKLTLTQTCLYFESFYFDHTVAVISLQDIRGISTFNFLGFIPTGLEIRQGNDTELFVVYKRNKWITFINQQIDLLRHEEVLENIDTESTEYISNDSLQDENNNTAKTLTESKQSPVLIDIMSCSENDLFNLNLLSKEQVVKIITERESGKIWYDIDSFAVDFALQPHEIIELQEKLVFPIKSKVKQGRKVDW